MSDLVGNSEERFSRDAAQLYYFKTLLFGISSVESTTVWFNYMGVPTLWYISLRCVHVLHSRQCFKVKHCGESSYLTRMYESLRAVVCLYFFQK